MTLADNLKEARNNKKITQEELAKTLGKSKNVISNWERGDNKPDADTLFLLCDILDVDANYLLGWSDNKDISLSIREQKHIKKFRQLDIYGKKAVENLTETEFERVQEQSTVEKEQERRYESEYAMDIPITYPKTDYLTGLSAGTGLYVFDDIPTQVIQVPEKYKCADFVIGVSGDSMEPTYYNGDKVAVKKAPTINVGEIGVFMIDGNGYIKEFGEDKLISHNKEYDDIGINNNTTCIGKVLGKI